jgi:thiosulfate/3-mercaptopyruvate sulfurtransferase
MPSPGGVVVQTRGMPSPLVTAAELARQLRVDPPPTLLDVRFDVATGADRPAYAQGHIPGACFVDLDRDLAGPPGTGGRHPLPAADDFTHAMRAAGVHADRPVVVYDAAAGLMAARAWWLLRYFGHPAVTLLDGGLAAWTAAGQPLATGSETPGPGSFVARPGGMPVLDVGGAAALPGRGVLLDARAPERFRGESEPLDPVAGHIPGARNRSTRDNVDDDGRFLDGSPLRAAFERVGARPGIEVGAYCGSGVTAAHQVLALELAGVPAALYPGSWSEWIADPSRPVATGPD